MSYSENTPTDIGVSPQSAKPDEDRHLSQLFKDFGEKYHVEPWTVGILLQRTAFRQESSREITKAEMIVLLIVAATYNLNPFTREIYAVADFDRIIPVVGVDGWSRMINSQASFDGMEFKYSETNVKMSDLAQDCYDWAECYIYRKDRSHPVVVREYLEENYLDTAQWNGKTRRMLRHKAMIQCARYAFGFVGIADPDDVAHGMKSEKIFELADRPDTKVIAEPNLSGGLAQAKLALEKIAVCTSASTSASNVIKSVSQPSTNTTSSPAQQMQVDFDNTEQLFSVMD